jgi:hypothetical protein
LEATGRAQPTIARIMQQRLLLGWAGDVFCVAIMSHGRAGTGA